MMVMAPHHLLFLALLPIPPTNTMSSPALALESEADPTYTHFTHGEQFHALLRDFLARSVLNEEGGDAAREDGLVKEMGGIVSTRDGEHP